MEIKALILIFFSCLLYGENILKATALIKINDDSLKCAVVDEDYVDVKVCNVVPIDGHSGKVNIDILLKKNVTNAEIQFIFKKRSNNEWRPFLFETKLNICDYFRNPQKYFVPNFVYGYFKDYISVNHTCPYYAGEGLTLKDCILNEKTVVDKIQVDSGEYGIFAKFFVNDKLVGKISGTVFYTK